MCMYIYVHTFVHKSYVTYIGIETSSRAAEHRIQTSQQSKFFNYLIFFFFFFFVHQWHLVVSWDNRSGYP